MHVYTVDEARTLLPDVIPLLQRLREAYLQLRAARSSRAASERGSSADGNSLVNPFDSGGEDALGAAATELEAISKQLAAWGIELKDPEQGLIDFNHRRNGDIVYLCFKLGEDDIRWWHRREDGFAGRTLLDV
jgi:hypothetical protein